MLRYAGFTILTDPNFLHAGDHVHLGYGLTAKRLTNPAMEIEELPPLDFCVLSHYHGDHLGLFHLGGTRIMGILVTMDAARGVEAVRIINPREVIPIHYNDYEVFKSPLEDFKRAIDEAGLGDRVTYLSHGETYNFEVPADRLQAA